MQPAPTHPDLIDPDPTHPDLMRPDLMRPDPTRPDRPRRQDGRMRVRAREPALRTAWLLVGAAIGLAAVLLLAGLVQVVAPHPGPVRVAASVLCLLPVLALGLLPGVRELEVTAARTMLGVTGDLVAPGRPRAQHRWRTALTVAYHLAAGMTAAALLVGVAPAAVALTVSDLRGRPGSVAGVRLPLVTPPAAVLLGLGCVVGALLGVWGLGRLSSGVAGGLLGPTPYDRLEVALARLETESEHTRLARELHDGIGHALTIIGVQAAAGRRTLARQPEQTGSALRSIEDTSRTALEELDGMLGLLRDDTPRTAAPDLARLPALVAAYRAAGMQLDVRADPDQPLPRLASTTAYRVVAEALNNAQRYAGPGPVVLALRQSPGLLTVEVRNRLRPGAARTGGGGLGLTGIGERVALFGGDVTAGAEDGGWVLRARIPLGVAGAGAGT